MSSPSSGKAWSARFPVYQIDFTAVASGKRVASTKRRVRWRFGFPNLKAMEDGATGTDCRGEEHDVTIVWSVTSGKRQITMDGREVHYSSSRSGVLDHSWATRGNHVVKVIAHAAPPLSATPGFRQYDLLIDGQSFFSMPKVYELGIRGPIPSHARVPGAHDYGNGIGPSSPMSANSGTSGARGAYGGGGGGGGGGGDYGVPGSRAEEEAALQLAIQASIAESRQHLDRKANDDQMSNYSQPAPSTKKIGNDAGVGDLLDFGGGGSGDDFPQIANTATTSYDNQSLASAHTAPPSYAAPSPSQNNAYLGANLGSGPPPAAPAPYGQPAPYQSPPPIQQAAPVNSPNPSMGGQLVPAHAPPGYYGAPPQAGGPPLSQPPPGSYQQPSPAAGPDYGQSYGAPPGQYGAPPTQQGGDVFGLSSPPPQDDPFAPKAPPPPSHNDIASSILGAYSSSGSMPTTPASAGAPEQNGATPESAGAPPQQNGWQPNGIALTMGALDISKENEEEEALNPLEAAMRKLVNIERIDEPAEQEVKLTMMKKEAAKKGPQGKSKALPPVGSGMVGTNATLSQIKEVKPSTAVDHEKIMRPPPPGLFQAGAVNAGALVVHGQGPPPLQQQTGFGLGAMMPNGGFHQQQQPHSAYGQAQGQQAHPGFQQQYPAYQQQQPQQQYYR